MKYERGLFHDCVNGRLVCLYIDCYDTQWMAQSKWGFRVRRGELKNTEINKENDI